MVETSTTSFSNMALRIFAWVAHSLLAGCIVLLVAFHLGYQPSGTLLEIGKLATHAFIIMGITCAALSMLMRLFLPTEKGEDVAFGLLWFFGLFILLYILAWVAFTDHNLPFLAW